MAVFGKRMENANGRIHHKVVGGSIVVGNAGSCNPLFVVEEGSQTRWHISLFILRHFNHRITSHSFLKFIHEILVDIFLQLNKVLEQACSSINIGSIWKNAMG